MDPERHPLDHNMRTRFEAWSDLAAAQCLAGDMKEALRAHKAALREAEKVAPATAESTQLRIRSCFALASLPWEDSQKFVHRMIEEAVRAVLEAVPRAVFTEGQLKGGSPPPGHPLLKNTESIVIADASGKQYAYNFMADFPGLAISAIPDKDRVNLEPIGHKQQLQQQLQQLQLLQEHQQLQQLQEQQLEQQKQRQEEEEEEEELTPWEKLMNTYRTPDQIGDEYDYSSVDYNIDYSHGLGDGHEDIAASTGIAPPSISSGHTAPQKTAAQKTAAEPRAEPQQQQQQQQQQRRQKSQHNKEKEMAEEHLHLLRLQQQIQQLQKKQQQQGQGQRTPLGPSSGVSSCRRCGALGPGAKLQMCSACSSVFYCSAACQKSDWKEHKASCKRAQKKVEEEPLLGGKGRAKQQGGRGKK